MEVIINKFYKTKNGRIVVIVRDLGCFATRLMTKTTNEKLTKETILEIVRDYYALSSEKVNFKFIEDPNAEDDVSITFYETCYGWEA